MNRKEKSSQLLCIFSRYPQAGRCKTRLVPGLGAEGAAHLQRQMTAHIVRVGQQADCDILIFLDGGSPRDISSWLGSSVEYVCQQGDDIGDKMVHGFAEGFARGYQRVILVGSDCPTIDPLLLEDGFAGLASHDLVLGPTFDGGYYLLGMEEMSPHLFVDIDWESDQVMAQTLAAAHGLKVKILTTLNDVDRPEDLDLLPASWQVEWL